MTSGTSGKGRSYSGIVRISRRDMFIWTIQNIMAWELLQRQGFLRGDGRRVEVYFRYAYRWMADQMLSRLPAVPGARFPLWGWYRWQGISRTRPDLRATGHLEKGTSGVRIELEIPHEKVLLSDFDAWHSVLNGSYLSISEKDEDAFAEDLKKAGPGWGWPYPEPFRSRVVSSWQRIFDMDAGEPEWWGALSERSVQATFWEIDLSQVRRADRFTAR